MVLVAVVEATLVVEVFLFELFGSTRVHSFGLAEFVATSLLATDFGVETWVALCVSGACFGCPFSGGCRLFGLNHRLPSVTRVRLHAGSAGWWGQGG